MGAQPVWVGRPADGEWQGFFLRSVPLADPQSGLTVDQRCDIVRSLVAGAVALQQGYTMRPGGWWVGSGRVAE